MTLRILYGFGGCGNFGDDYILDRWIDYYSKSRIGLNLCIARPDRWLESFYSEKRNVRICGFFHEEFSNAIESMRGVNADHIEHNISAGKKAAFEIISSPDYRLALRELESIQMFGGGYWNRRYAESWGMASMFSEISLALGIPIIATGVGITPVLQKNRRSVDEIISRFDLIEVRDIESYMEFSKKYPDTKVIFGSDDTFISPVHVRDASELQNPSINLCIQSNLAGDESHGKILNRILEFIDGFDNAFDLRYLKFHDGPDQIFLKKIEEALGENIRSYTKDEMLRYGLPISADDICITTRFHLHLLAARVGSRGAYVVTGDDYYSVKHKSVCDLGSNWINLLGSSDNLKDILTSNFSSIDETREQIVKISRVSSHI